MDVNGQNTADQQPDAAVMERWRALFLQCLDSISQKEVEQSTRGQALADDWYLERICRITAFKVKQIANRCRDFSSLTRQILFVSPPTHIPALQYGRQKEPVAVEMYCTRFPDRVVSECGLVVHPTATFIATSPDRMVHDPKADQPQRLLEVKCPFGTTETPEVAAEKKRGFCVKKDGETITLDHTITR